MSDTERLDWVLKQLDIDRDDLDWAIAQGGYLEGDQYDLYPSRSFPWSKEAAERRANPSQVSQLIEDFLVERIFPKIPVSPQPGEYHFRKAKA